MTSEQKKALLLLNSVIFNYHGFDAEEQKILDKIADEINSKDELDWVNNFVQEDVGTLFERAREFFKTTIALYDQETKLSYLSKVWESTNIKGYITEMEAMAILKLAKDWGVQRDFLAMVRK
jgi:hypothetical protein